MEEEGKEIEETLPDTSQEAEMEGYFDLPSPAEYIAAAYNALNAIEMADPGLTYDIDLYTHKIYTIRQNCIDIIYEQIKYIKDCIIPPDEPSE